MEISILLMVKNEEKCLHTTLNSIISLPNICTLFVLDTGSTDNTIDCITLFCKTNDIKLILWTRPFDDFETSRNYLLEQVNNHPFQGYGLLLDAKDEIQFIRDEPLIKDYYYIKKTFILNNREYTCNFLGLIKFPTDLKYTGLVHEYLTHPDKHIQVFPYSALQIIQYRDQNDIQNRIQHDYSILVNKSDLRSKYYLSVVYLQMNECTKAFEECKSIVNEFKDKAQSQFDHECIYECTLTCAKLSLQLQYDFRTICLPWMQCTLELNPYRMEGYILFAQYYHSINNNTLAKVYINHACTMTQPKCNLFPIDSLLYTKTRWDLQSLIS